MTSSHDHVMEIFHQARKLPTERQADFVHHRCQGDEDLRSEVTSLLMHHHQPALELDGQVMREAAARVLESAERNLRPDDDSLPAHIGPFGIRQRIASGGMGTVYRGVQEDPPRPVAVKVMSRGLASKNLRRRFEHEVELLSRLRHSGIAQVFHAGTCEEGDVPYFAMEYVAGGKPITDYACENRLPLRKRLEIFVDVCDAVHYGHERGIIHRDLKPANILVDGDGIPESH